MSLALPYRCNPLTCKSLAYVMAKCGGRRSILLWLDLRLSVNLCLLRPSFRSASQLPYFPATWDRKSSRTWNCYFPSFMFKTTGVQVGYFLFSTLIRLKKINFSWRQAFVNEKIILEVYFTLVTFPSPCWKHKRIFLQYLLLELAWASRGKPHNIVPHSPTTGSLRSFKISELISLGLQYVVN